MKKKIRVVQKLQIVKRPCSLVRYYRVHICRSKIGDVEGLIKSMSENRSNLSYVMHIATSILLELDNDLATQKGG